MKIYLVAHGTMDGYEQYPKQTEYSDISKSIYDLRAELDSSGDFLSKPLGYYIQMDTNGVWVSIIKLMRDGESDGNRPGFFAISAFIPVSCTIHGSDLKNKLDFVMSQYLNSYTNGMRTCSIGVDWSFVTNAAAELNALCQPRRKAINTYYVPSEQFAYVPVTTEEQIIQYLDKPFQPEYGKFKAVFLGTHLQHPMRLPQQTRLDIDLENEVYDIIWRGNTQEWPNLPQTVRKKDIENGFYQFEKQYYHSCPVQYSKGVIDKDNATLTLGIPALQPEINKLTLQYNYFEAVVQVVASAQNRTIYDNSNSNVLEFSGEEFASQIKIHLSLKDGYRCDDIVLTPCKCPNSTHFVPITKMQQISLQILEHNENQTRNFRDNIRINNKLGKSFYPDFDKGRSLLCLSIPENEDFIKEYSVSLVNGTYYSLNGLSEIQKGFYRVNIQRKQNISTVANSTQKKPIYLDCRNISKIKVYYDNSPCSITNNRIEIPFAGTRDKITVTFGNKKLKFKKIGNNEIKIKSPIFTLPTDDNVKLILMGAGVLLVLLVFVFFALQLTHTIDATKWFTNNEKNEAVYLTPSEENTQHTSNSLILDSVSNEGERISKELAGVLEVQRKEWNYKVVYEIVKKYENNPSVKDPSKKSYQLFRELVWMRCRKRLDGYLLDDKTGKWKPYQNYKAFNSKNKLINSWIFGVKKYGINSENNTYATPELMDFLTEIVNAPDDKQKQFFEKHVKTKKIETLTFHQVKELWEKFEVKTDISGPNSKTSNQNDNNSHSTNQNKQTPPAGEQSENF